MHRIVSSIFLFLTQKMQISAFSNCVYNVCVFQFFSFRFGHKLIVSDLHKLTDTVAIRDQGSGRLVCLLPSSQARQSPLGSSQSHDGSSANCSPIIFEELEYHEPVCKQHCLNKDFM